MHSDIQSSFGKADGSFPIVQRVFGLHQHTQVFLSDSVNSSDYPANSEILYGGCLGLSESSVLSVPHAVGRNATRLLLGQGSKLMVFSWIHDVDNTLQPPVKIWEVEINCTVRQVLRVDGVDFVTCLNETDRYVALHAVDVFPLNSSDFHHYEVQRIAMPFSDPPVSAVSTFDASYWNGEYYIAFGLKRTIYFFKPFNYSSGKFNDPLPPQECDGIIKLHQSKADTLLAECSDIYYVYSIRFETWLSSYPKFRKGELKPTMLFECPGNNISLILNGTELSFR